LAGVCWSYVDCMGFFTYQCLSWFHCVVIWDISLDNGLYSWDELKPFCDLIR
jgi:hypothetical protein